MTVRGQSDGVEAIISLLIVTIVVLVAFALFDPLAQMGPQTGELGEANRSLTDAVSILPLLVGGIGFVIAIIGSLRMMVR